MNYQTKSLHNRFRRHLIRRYARRNLGLNPLVAFLIALSLLLTPWPQSGITPLAPLAPVPAEAQQSLTDVASPMANLFTRAVDETGLQTWFEAFAGSPLLPGEGALYRSVGPRSLYNHLFAAKPAFAQTAALTYGSPLDLSGAVYAGFSEDYNVTAQIMSVSGLAFNNDGTKMFVVGYNTMPSRPVFEYHLATPFDVSTATYSGNSVASQTSVPQSIGFNNDGTKLFVVSQISSAIKEFALSTAFDLSTATYATGEDLIYGGHDGTGSLGFAFNNDGTKIFIVGARIGTDAIYEYALSTAFDVSTGSFTGVRFTVPHSAHVEDITFNNDGTKMYIAGGGLLEYTLSAPFDISSPSLAATLYVGAENATPNEVKFNNDGSRMFGVHQRQPGRLVEKVNEYHLCQWFTEAASDDGSITAGQSGTLRIAGETFTNGGGTLTHGVDYTITNLPAGLTPTLAVDGSGSFATLTFSGNAVAHSNASDVSNLLFDFADSAFAGGSAAAVLNATGPASSCFQIDFSGANTAPTITAGQVFTVPASAPNGTTVGTVAASDPDSDPLTFSISGGNPGGDAFAIDTSSGLITVNNSGSLPAVGTAVPLTINVDDGNGGSHSQTVTITIASPVVLLKVLLQGAYDPTSGLMRDDLRTANLLPAPEPYTAMPSYSHVLSGGGETVANPTTVFADNGPNSIVDWVFVELRDAAAPGTVVATRAGLLQRDGDVVDIDGTSSLLFRQAPTASYYVGVRHRNHLGAMTKSAIALTANGVAVDFTDTGVDFWESSPLFQAHEQNNIGGNYALWAGDAEANQKVVFAGQNNDSDAIFNAVDQAPLNYLQLQTYILSGYYPTDINLDGKVIFAGQNNDLDIIFNTVTGHPGNPLRLPTYAIPQQMAQ